MPEAFAADLKFERAVQMITRLEKFAASRGREFGIKLTNTLVVGNERGVMPGAQMYLSGKPLHVMAVTLLDRLTEAVPGKFRLGNVRRARTGGLQCGYRQGQPGRGRVAGPDPGDHLQRPAETGRVRPHGPGAAQAGQDHESRGHDRACGSSNQDRSQGGRSRSPRFGAGGRAASGHAKEGAAPYSLAATGKPLRQVDTKLRMFDCVACTNCVSVCPNDAFFQVPSKEREDLEARAQYLVLAELCNDCGNCTTFCPEEGAPHLIKPRLFTDPVAWESAGRQGFLLNRTPDKPVSVQGGRRRRGPSWWKPSCWRKSG